MSGHNSDRELSHPVEVNRAAGPRGAAHSCKALWKVPPAPGISGEVINIHAGKLQSTNGPGLDTPGVACLESTVAVTG